LRIGFFRAKAGQSRRTESSRGRLDKISSREMFLIFGVRFHSKNQRAFATSASFLAWLGDSIHEGWLTALDDLYRTLQCRTKVFRIGYRPLAMHTHALC
jgi:hypothetical protein